MVPRFIAGLTAALCVSGAIAQTSIAQSTTPLSSSGPVAYVYVAAGNKVYGYSTSSSGTLTPVQVTTTSGLIWHLSVTKKFLFGIDGGSNIYSFAIQENGSLLPISVLSAEEYAPDTCFASGVLQVDESGSNLYAEVGNCDQSSAIISFQILPTGQLVYLGKAYAQEYAVSQLRLSQDNKYAFQTGCLAKVSNEMVTSATAETDEYKRESNGYLTYVETSHDVPEGKGTATYCPMTVGNDAWNHLAFVYLQYQPEEGPGTFGEFYGDNYPLSVYTVASDGALSTNSNYENMAVSEVYPTTISIAPSGSVMAVGGDEGYQFFHFNGANQPVKWTGPFSAGGTVTELGWDQMEEK